MSTPATPSVAPYDTEPFGRLADTMTAAGALAAAIRLGVLTRLGRRPADAVTVAADCGLTTRGAGLLLEALAALGLVRADADGRYSPGGIPSQNLERLLELTDGLTGVLRTGVPAIAAGTPDGAGRLYPGAVPHLGSMMARPAAMAAERLVGAGVTAGEVLDVGAGAAPWSLAFARAVPGCRVTVLELPEVLPVTRAAVDAADRTGRFGFLSGDALTADLPSGAYDLVLAGNLCHLFDGVTNRRLITRLAATLRPGGTLAILDVLPDTPAADPRSVALYALGLFARASEGGLHPFGAYRQWLSGAGLAPPDRTDLSDAPPITLVHARRR